jgi:hypothetical protein
MDPRDKLIAGSVGAAEAAAQVATRLQTLLRGAD